MLLFICSACSNDNNLLYEKSSDKFFTDIILDTEFAITENNFRITNRLHIGEAIQERENTSFPQNEVILFCNLTLAEEMLRIEPRYINYCPYKITITEVDSSFMIATSLLPTTTDNAEMDKIAKKINMILRTMVEYAASDNPFIIE